MTAVLESARVAVNPFKVLDFFTEVEQASFAGRDREIHEVVAGVLRGPTLVLYGRSGLGKTSLLLAGLFPELRSRGLQPIYVRILNDPMSDLQTAIEDAFGIKADPGDLPGLLRRAPRQRGIVLVLDQFEEFFIQLRSDPAKRWELIDVVSRLVADRALETSVVFSLREDFLANLDEFRVRLPELFANEYRLHPLTAFGTHQAISRALEQSGVRFEPRLVSSLVDSLERDNFDPTALQILGSELYLESQARAAGGEQPVLSLEVLRGLGGVEGIFRRFLEAAIAHAGAANRLLVLTVLDQLITPEHTKRTRTVRELGDFDFTATEAEITSILAVLMQHHLVRPTPHLGEPRFELVHDRLVELIEAYMRSDPQFLEFRGARGILANAARDGAFRGDRELLLTAGQIRRYIEPFKERLRFKELEQELMVRSAVYRDLPETAYWASRWQPGLVDLLLAEWCMDSSSHVRAVAFGAVSRLGSTDDLLTDLAITAAVHDPAAEVRRAASRSLRTLGPNQIGRVEAALRQKGTRKPAIEMLADLVEKDVALPGIGWWSRRQARRVADQRKIAANRKAISRARMAGATSGGLAASALCCCLGILLMKAPTRGGLQLLSGFILIGALVGAGLGALVARRLARLVVLKTHYSWWQACRPRTTVSIAALASICLMRVDPATRAMAVFAIGGLLALCQMPWAEACLASKVSRPAAWKWTFLLCCGGPFMAALWICLAAQRVFLSAAEYDVAGVIIVGGIVWSFCLAVWSIALSAAERELPLAAVRRPGRRPGRRLAAALALACLVSVGWLCGVSSIPWMPPYWELEGSRRMTGDFGLPRPITKYQVFKCAGDRPAWITLHSRLDQPLVSVDGGDDETKLKELRSRLELPAAPGPADPTAAVMSPGFHIVGVSPKLQPKLEMQRYDLEISCHPLADVGTVASIPQGNLMFASVTFGPRHSPARIGSVLTKGSWKPGSVVALALVAPENAILRPVWGPDAKNRLSISQDGAWGDTYYLDSPGEPPRAAVHAIVALTVVSPARP
jgi:hypothetical protein